MYFPAGTGEFGKEEILLFLLSYLIQNYGHPFESCIPECRQEIERACEYMVGHFTERIYLGQICRHAGLSKSTLLRAFTKEKGVTPYCYLETVRINEAKKCCPKGFCLWRRQSGQGFQIRAILRIISISL